MKLRTTLLALVTVAILCGALAFVAVANADLELSASSVSCMPGETVTVTVNIDQNPGFYFLQLYLVYDTEALELVSVKNETNLSLTSGIAHIWNASGINDYTATGALATLTFTVKENAPDGAYEIGVLTDYIDCCNANEEMLNVTFANGVIDVCDHSETKTVAGTLPTCTEAGENIIYCAGCGIELSRETVAPLGHTEGDWTVVAEPTCTEEGKQIKKCTVCGETVEVGVVAALGHKTGDWTVKTAPTCTEEGVQIKICTVCSEVAETGSIPAKGHGESCAVEVKTPTCTEEGEIWNVCLDCDAVLSVESIPANGHVEGEWTVQVEATCTAGGVNVKLCTVCEEILETESTPMIEHDYDGGVVTSAPTCAAEGVLTYTCEACGHSYTKAIAKVPHTYDALGVCSACGTKSALYISTSQIKGRHDETVTVKLVLDRNAGANFLSLAIDYDADALELVSVENSGLFNMTKGEALYVFNASGANDVTATGTLVTLTFTIKETAEADVTYPITVTVYDCNNANEELVDAVAGNGSILVYDFIYGDINGDGKITGMDVTRLLRYIANRNPITGESSVEIEPGADCNGDGKITGMDVTRLLRYIANRNPITGESSVILGPAN